MKLPAGVRRLFRLGTIRPEVRRDVDDELHHHFDEAVRSLVAAGRTEEEATEEARRRFGNEADYRRRLERIDERGVRMRKRGEKIDAVLQMVHHAVRGVRRAPGFTAAVVSILALGIGANAVMFGVVDRLLLSPPQHIVDADEVRNLYIQREIFNGEIRAAHNLTYPDYNDFQTVGAFASVAGFSGPREMTVGRGESAGQARVLGASASLFPLLGVQPTTGRFFSEEEDAIDARATAVLSSEYWERRYGSDPEILGRTLDVGAGTYTIIGIAPQGFTGATLDPVDIIVPLITKQHLENGDGWVTARGWYWFRAVARLAPGATVEAAEAEATAAHRNGRAELIAEDRYDPDAEILVAPIIAAHGPNPSGESQVARWLAGVSLVVLLIACFNVANLLLARAIQARREIAVRLALGVGRGRLIGSIVAEGLLLAGLGATCAVLVARFLSDTVHQALLPNVAFVDGTLAGRLLLFVSVATLVVGLVIGIVPAIHATRTDVGDSLRSGGRGVAGYRSRTRVSLLVGQAALSVVLLVGAGLFVRSLRAARAVDLGYDAKQLVVVRLEWNEELPGAERRQVYEEAITGVRRIPGVRAAGLTYTVPFRSSISLGRPRVPGLDSIPRHERGGPYVNKVGAGYFEAMDLRILQGRGFEPADDADSAPPVTVLSESMAQAIWPGGGALGACMILGSDEDQACTEVVGIVENHNRQELVEENPHFMYYVNQAHPEFQGPPQAMMVAASNEPDAILPNVRAEARSTSTLIRFVSAWAMQDFIEPEMRSWTLGASMFTVFGLLALIVAAWGLYSVLAFDVALRTHELGIRSALGAGVSRIVRLVLRQAIALVTAGTLVGLLVAAGAARFVQPLLFNVSATDALTYLVVAGSLVVVAGIAGFVPAWRATRIDPREALQTD